MRRVTGAVVILAGLAAAFCLGYFTHRNSWIPRSLRNTIHDTVAEASVDARASTLPAGEWYPFVSRRPAGTAQALPDEARQELSALGYLPAYSEATAQQGVTVYDKTAAYPGRNLFISGHKPEAYLMDMEGRILHTWSYDFEKLWPNFSPPPYVRNTGHLYWRRVHVFPNGDLLAIHQGIGLIKLDHNSNLLWARRGGYHHDLSVTDDGTIYVLDRDERALPAGEGEGFVMEPYLSVLDSAGRTLKRVPLLECFRNSPFAPLLSRLAPTGDLFHTNTIQVFDGSLAGRSPHFARGKVLISIWTLDAAAIVDVERETVEWVQTGLWRRQHEPTLLPNGNMIVFDNRGNEGRSRIIEVDPLTLDVAWTYQGALPDDFYSQWCGAVQRLPNGNTLITETNNGRAFEVTRGGITVWEFVNPHQIQQGDMTLVASLWEVTRLPSDFGAGWIDATTDER